MALLAIILGLLPGFAWLFFYLKEDLHPEPRKLIALTFLMGAVSALFALSVQVFVDSIFDSFDIAGFSLIAIVVLALIEEIAKFGAAYIVVSKDPDFNEPVDAMIYLVVAALGFATLENLGAMGGLFGDQGSQLATVSNVFNLTSMRFVGATLLHSLTSALLGFYWAKSIREFGNKKAILMGFLIATGLHAVFNYLIILSETITYSLVLVIIVGFFTLNDFEILKKEPV